MGYQTVTRAEAKTPDGEVLAVIKMTKPG